MSHCLAADYAACDRLARRAASNFYLSFALLDPARRRAMTALYAFLRQTDDLGDNPRPVEERLAALACWRAALDRALAGSYETPVLAALADSVARFGIPPAYLRTVIDGVQRDVAGVRFGTYGELAHYCYQVAVVVGFACLHVWGYSSPAVFGYAYHAGLAFQLTNVLRDLREDALAGRVYLPAEDLDRFGYSEGDLLALHPNEAFCELLAFEAARAETLFDQSVPLAEHLSPTGRAAFGTMSATYRALLSEIRRAGPQVLRARVCLNRWRKLRIAARWLPRAPHWPWCAWRLALVPFA
ncbi:MAG: squalene/phytoene synthase family protein [Pirellulales bacterium]|nr:squalene/phytoene synthase family protein [Pirellulales bacterium]